MKMKVIIVGVGNSGTKLLGILINELLSKYGFPDYYYEPLYWGGTRGEAGIVLNPEAIKEHCSFPLLPDDTVDKWPWMDRFIDKLNGLAKFIRAGSRIKTFINHPVRIIWITRELYSFLASMQQNFPRCPINAGWHHSPPEYDDYERLKSIYLLDGFEEEKGNRHVAEACWWHLHNNELNKFKNADNILFVRYEDLCQNPWSQMKQVAKFIGVDLVETSSIQKVHSPSARDIVLKPRTLNKIDRICGDLNRLFYPG